MPNQAYMTLEGEKQGSIEGSCDQEEHQGEIIVHAFEHEIVTPTDNLSGKPTGKRMHRPFRVTKEYDLSSPNLYRAVSMGENLPKVEVKWFRVGKTGGEEHYFTITLEDAVIVGMEPFMKNCQDPAFATYGHLERVSFAYKKISWLWVLTGNMAEDSWTVTR